MDREVGEGFRELSVFEEEEGNSGRMCEWMREEHEK